MIREGSRTPFTKHPYPLIPSFGSSVARICEKEPQLSTDCKPGVQTHRLGHSACCNYGEIYLKDTSIPQIFDSVLKTKSLIPRHTEKSARCPVQSMYRMASTYENTLSFKHFLKPVNIRTMWWFTLNLTWKIDNKNISFQISFFLFGTATISNTFFIFFSWIEHAEVLQHVSPVRSIYASFMHKPDESVKSCNCLVLVFAVTHIACCGCYGITYWQYMGQYSDFYWHDVDEG